MAVIGILARIDGSQIGRINARLALLSGVTPFSVEEDGRIGILLERDSINDAHAALRDEVDVIPGILGTWPVFGHVGENLPGEAVARVTHSAEADVNG